MNPRNELLVFDLAEYKVRLKKVRESMRKAGIDVALITAQEDNTYLTGYPHGPPPHGACLIIPLDGETTIIERLIEIGNVDLILGKTVDRAFYWKDTSELVLLGSSALYKMVGKELREHGLASKNIGLQFGSSSFTALSFKMLKKTLPKATFVDCTSIVEQLRLIKSPAEIAYIKTAAEIASKGCAAGIDATAKGVSENGVAVAVYNAMLDCRDYEFTWMAPHVASGPRSALAHTTWSGRILKEGDTVYLEIPASVNRYHAVTLRTVSVGSPNRKMQKVAKVISQALNEAIATMRPGVRAGEVDAACRNVIREAGYAEYFRHRTGYTIGIDWVQPHGINIVPENPAVLKAGMTFHIIPICMFVGEGAVGMSDSVLVTDNGTEILTHLSRKLFVK